MSRHIAALANVVRGVPLQIIGEAMGRAVALTDTELITVRAQLFRTHIERFRLGTLIRVRPIHNPHARVLEVEFGGSVPTILILMFGPRAAADFDLITTLLRRRLGRGARGRLLDMTVAARRRQQLRAVRSPTHANLARSRSLAV